MSAHRRNGVLIVKVEDDGVGGAHAENGSGLRGLADRVEALGGRLVVESPADGGNPRCGGNSVRVVIAGRTRCSCGKGSPASRSPASRSRRRWATPTRCITPCTERPDVVVVDVRMPPTQTDEGARAAREIREQHPEVAILVLSQVVEAKHALELFSDRPEGFGYLLKDRSWRWTTSSSRCAGSRTAARQWTRRSSPSSSAGAARPTCSKS